MKGVGLHFVLAFLCLLLALAQSVQVSDSDVEIVESKRSHSGQYHGFDLKSLSKRDIIHLSNVEDEIVQGELDLWSARRQIGNGSTRGKRWLFLGRAIWNAGRALFRSSRLTKISRSGKRRMRMTKQYSKPGGYSTALRDYRKLRVEGSRPISGKNGKRGYTGKVGDLKVTVRNTSSGKNPKPTLSITSKNGRTVRKFRYEN